MGGEEEWHNSDPKTTRIILKWALEILSMLYSPLIELIF